MRCTATVTSKGQVTVPSEIRNQLGLKQGDQIEFVAEGGTVIIHPARAEPNVFSAFVGALGPFQGGREGINAWIRDLRDDEE